MGKLVLVLVLVSSLLGQNITSKTNEQILLKGQLELKDTFDDQFENEFETQEKFFDPLEPYNRLMTSFNDFFYIKFAEPTAKGYAYLVPKQARVAVSQFFNNIMFPVRLVNNILQFKFKNAFEETGRFLINSTFGFLGFLDPAKKHLHWEKHNEDFGQTLGFYGFKGGFPIVLPFLGPSNLRDSIGLVADNYISPMSNLNKMDYKIPDNNTQTFIAQGIKNLNDNSLKMGQYESIKIDAIDLYFLLMDTYNQHREEQIRE